MPADESSKLDGRADEPLDATDLPWHPKPGTLAATVPWLSAPPPITVQEMGTAFGLLCDLAGECSLVVISARTADPADRFLDSITRVQDSFHKNLDLLVRAALTAQIAKKTVEPSRCGDVTMETMHAAVIQMACNIAEWRGSSGRPPDSDSVEVFRRGLARDSMDLPARLAWADPGPPLVNLADVLFRLRAESVFAQRYLSTVMTDDSNWMKVSQAAKLSGATLPEVTKACNAGTLSTNGKTGRRRRIQPASFVSWMEAREHRPERRESYAVVKRRLDPAGED